MVRHIESWWKDNKSKSVAAGIRAQLPHGDFYAQIWMAKQLALLDKENGYPNREFALQHMRTLVRDNWGHAAAYAARALAEFDDTSAVDLIYTRWKRSLDGPGRIYNSSLLAGYLMEHGGRREWELLHTIAKNEIAEGRDARQAEVLSALVNCRIARTSPRAIPGLGLALTRTKNTGSRTVEGENPQPFSYADKATEYLQQLTEQDFGYRHEGSADERTAAIRKAQAWWQAEGSKKYTFDYVETLAKKTQGTK